MQESTVQVEWIILHDNFYLKLKINKSMNS